MNHSEYIAGGIRVSYWRRADGIASIAADKADAQSVRVGDGWASLEFELPGQSTQFDRLKAMLEEAHRRGGLDARSDIRKALGI